MSGAGRAVAAELKEGLGCGGDDGAAVPRCRVWPCGGCTAVPQPEGLWVDSSGISGTVLASWQQGFHLPAL